MPGALGELLRAKPRSRDPRDGLLLLCGLWALITYVLMSLSATKFHHYIFPAVPPLAILAGLFLDRLRREGPGEHVPALLLGVALVAVVGYSLWLKPQSFAHLFVYNYERPYPERELSELHPGRRLGPFLFSLSPRAVVSSLSLALGVGLGLGLVGRSARFVVGTLVAAALALSLWLSWFHWRELSPHWTQRDIFFSYLRERSSPDEQVVAYFMNWRGETFYGRNRVREVMDDERMREIAARPGRLWVITEKGRYPALRSAIGAMRALRIVDQASNKYELVAVEDGASTPGPGGGEEKAEAPGRGTEGPPN
jgi:hypothetical protein